MLCLGFEPEPRDQGHKRIHWTMVAPETSFLLNNRTKHDSGCGSIGKAVSSNARGPRFESSHRQTFISDFYLFTVNCIEKTKIKKKRPRMAQLKK